MHSSHESRKCSSVLYCNTFVTFMRNWTRLFKTPLPLSVAWTYQDFKKRWPPKFSSCSLLLQSSHSHVKLLRPQGAIQVHPTHVCNKDRQFWGDQTEAQEFVSQGHARKQGLRTNWHVWFLCFHCHKLSDCAPFPPSQILKTRISWGRYFTFLLGWNTTTPHTRGKIYRMTKSQEDASQQQPPPKHQTFKIHNPLRILVHSTAPHYCPVWF